MRICAPRVPASWRPPTPSGASWSAISTTAPSSGSRRSRCTSGSRPTDAPPPQQTAALIVRAGDELTLAIEELRELAHGLPPALLAKLGLAGAIRSIAARASTPVKLVELPSVRLDDTAEATAYYVIAEAVTNAQRYSHADTIWISAVVSPHVVEILVADDGVGGANEVMSSGLQGLRDRVEAIGGSFELESPRGRGTRVAAAIPAMADEDRWRPRTLSG